MATSQISPGWLKNADLNIYDAGTAAATANAGNAVLGLLTLSGTAGAWAVAHFAWRTGQVKAYNPSLYAVAVSTANKVTLAFPYDVIAAVCLTGTMTNSASGTEAFVVSLVDIVPTPDTVHLTTTAALNGTTPVQFRIEGICRLGKIAQLQIWGSIAHATQTITIDEPTLSIKPLALVVG